MARARSPASRKPPPSSAAGAGEPFDGDPAGLVVMGRIVAPFGVQGWFKLKAYTAQPDGLDEFAEWVVRTPEGWRYMALEEFAVRPAGTAAKLAGCDDRDAALRLRGADIAVPREALGEAEAGTLFLVDLVGLEVVDGEGRKLGVVESFFETGDTSVMVVRDGRERMIPFVPGYVEAVDREARRITVDWKADYDA